jgi:hypothetical protein
MADAKVSALTGIASGLLATGDKFPVADASDLTVSYSATAGNIKTFVNTAPVFAAGSASAGTWPLFTAGTLLTTPEDGAVEMDADCFYLTTDAGNRGYIPVRHFIRADATRTFTSNTSAQAIFTSPANGRITLETGLYRMQGLLAFTSMSTTSGNLSLSLIGAGTATISAYLWHVIGQDVATATAGAVGGSWSATAASPASAATAGAAAALILQTNGTFEVTAAGTLIPSITMVTGSASVLSIGSYLMIERMGSTSVVSVGQWD